MEHGDGSSSLPATAMTFPPPVSSCNQRDPALNVQEQEFVDEFDSTHLDKQQECTDVIIDPAQFSIDAFDNELALLESTPDVDGKQLNRYKSLTKTLRNSLAAACLTVGKLMKIIDARDLQLRDSSSYSAADVLAGLKPTTTKVDKAVATCLALDEKFSNEIAKIRSELTGVLTAVETSADISAEWFDKVLKKLGLFGMVDNGCTFDNPAAISSIYRMLNDVVVPVFMAGNVTSFVGPPPVANPLLFPPGTVGDGSSATATPQKRSYDSMVGSAHPAMP